MADLLKQLEAKRDTGRLAFLAHKAEIAEALRKGYTAKAIWQGLKDEGGMPVGYEAFLRYARELPEYAARARGGAARPVTPAREPERVRSKPVQPFALGTGGDAVRGQLDRRRK